VFLYEVETWFLTLRDEHGLKVFENGLLRRIFELKGDEVTGSWRKLHNRLYFSSCIIKIIQSRRIRWIGHVIRMGYEDKCI
jgi:hypothetical protein